MKTFIVLLSCVGLLTIGSLALADCYTTGAAIYCDPFEGATEHEGWLVGRDASDTYICQCYSTDWINWVLFDCEDWVNQTSLKLLGTDNVNVFGLTSGTITCEDGYSDVDVTAVPLDWFQGVSLSGGDEDDTLIGASYGELLYGEGGDDSIYAGGGNDTLWGGEDNDWLKGGPGNDFIYGGNGDDSLLGMNGVDSLFGEGEVNGDDCNCGSDSASEYGRDCESSCPATCDVCI